MTTTPTFTTRAEAEPRGQVVKLITGDCREVMAGEGPFDVIIADPPYGDTSLAWDRRVHGWLEVAHARLKPTGSLWLFGSMRSFIGSASAISRARFRYAQDVVWEKHNGSGFAVDRFRRIHEHAVQLYRGDSPWSGVFNDVQTTPDAVARQVTRRKSRPPHTGNIGAAPYVSVDGGDRIMCSVIPMRSMHGRAIHPTEKPSSLMEILIRTSCPEGGLVGDFFAGSGAAGEACAMSERNYVGCEIDPDMAAKARARLAGNLFSGAAA
jgi:site-specific DNA-methyltransferase (adenine-specific)